MYSYLIHYSIHFCSNIHVCTLSRHVCKYWSCRSNNFCFPQILKVFSQISYSLNKQFQTLNLFVALLQEAHFPKGVKVEIISVWNNNFLINSCQQELIKNLTWSKIIMPMHMIMQCITCKCKIGNNWWNFGNYHFFFFFFFYWYILIHVMKRHC